MTAFGCQGSPPPQTVRKPAVAGQFYPSDPGKLRSEVERHLAAQKQRTSPPVLLISPHAGYVFSGPVAGIGIATVDRATRTVILVGPSHHLRFEGVSIPDVDAYETPLGRVPLDKVLVAKLRANPAVKALPAAHRDEHCLEVQIPFLQVRLQQFSIVPIVTGDVDPGLVARMLLPHIRQGVLVIASSDLSHYQSQEKAKEIDGRSIKTILARDVDGFLDGCGEVAVRTVMELGRKLDFSPVLLDARTSFETAPPRYKSEDRVVGYATIAFVRGAVTHDGEAQDIPEETKRFLLALARASLESAVRGKPLPAPDSAPAFAKDPSGCFVTLTKKGELRGCIGYIEPIKPLVQAIIDNAKNSALNDNRFEPVRPEELADIKVEVSVLTPPQPLAYSSPQDLLAKLVPAVDGIILQQDYRQSTFLPQVWEQLPDKVQFLEHLSLKGGMNKDGWKNAKVKRYRAIHFQE